jgi:hypothetical protein
MRKFAQKRLYGERKLRFLYRRPTKEVHWATLHNG